VQVGDTDAGATVWQGTAASAVDLDALIPRPSGVQIEESFATGVDSSGDVFGYANLNLGFDEALEWTPSVSAPEPGGSALLGFAALGLLARRRRRASATP